MEWINALKIKPDDQSWIVGYFDDGYDHFFAVVYWDKTKKHKAVYGHTGETVSMNNLKLWFKLPYLKEREKRKRLKGDDDDTP